MTFSEGSPFSDEFGGFRLSDSINLDGMEISIVRAEKFCPVCGTPSGNCVPEGHEPETEVQMVGEWLAGPNEKTFRVPHDVSVETQVSSNHFSVRPLVKEGDMITRKFAKEIGLID